MDATLTEFSLVGRGPCDRLQARIGLLGPQPLRVKRRALLTAAVAWLPLLAFAIFDPQPHAFISFRQDIAVHVRFLLVIPLLIVIEHSIGLRTRLVARDFTSCGLVADGDAPKFLSALRTTERRLDSVWPEIVTVVLTYAFIVFVLRLALSDGVLFWFEQGSPDAARLSHAGWWYASVSSPIVGFLFLRWVWRYAMWSWFLRRVSRLDLRIAGSHPDRAGGLGFINIAQVSFASITFAASCVLAAAAANRILYEHIKLTAYQPLIIGFVVVSLVVGLAPLLSFTRPLVIAKWNGLLAYGRFSTDYVHAFERKWLNEGEPSNEPALGSGDIQSLSDLGGGFDRVDQMRTVPFDRRTALAFAVAAAAPMLPLLLTVMPLREIVKLVVKAML